MSVERFIFLEVGASRPAPTPLSPSISVKAGAEDTEGRFSLLENRTSARVPGDVGDALDRFVYVLDGELAVDSGDSVQRLTGGMCALLPRGGAHVVRNPSGRPVHALHLSSLSDSEHHAAKGVEDRFYSLAKGEGRPGRVPLPPAFAVKVRSEDAEGRFSLLEVIVAQEIPRHVHHVADECIYVLDGELTVEFDDRIRTATAGQFVLLPLGVPHALRPGSTPPPRVIQISAPGGWECFVEDMIENRPLISRQGRLDPAALNRLAERHHITYEEQTQ